MVVIGVRFKRFGKVYYFDPKNLDIKKQDHVIVETAKGMEFAEVVLASKQVSPENIVNPVKSVLRVATEEDYRKVSDNKHKECKAIKLCTKKINEHKLAMKLVSAEYSFDSSKVVFYFTAEGRVDFRELVKELASMLKVRIELRQIGVRDEARMIGGIGPCGRRLCCEAFLGDFDAVSIKMAKEQSLSLNPTKISGVCGRLMCCLKYEQCCYEEVRSRMPKINKEVMTPKGKGIVVDINVLGEKVKIKLISADGAFEIADFPLSCLQFQRTGSSDSEQDDLSDINEEIKLLLDQ